MKETPQQYIKRMLGNVGKKNPLAVQRATPARLARLVRGLSRTQLRRRPAPGKWSINEIVAHLADTELVGGYRIRTILGKNRAPIQGFDQDAWAARGSYNRVDARRAIERFRVLREGNLALIRSLSPRQMKQYGMHSERGKETISRIVHMFAGHDVNHLGQIERIRRSLGK